MPKDITLPSIFTERDGEISSSFILDNDVSINGNINPQGYSLNGQMRQTFGYDDNTIYFGASENLAALVTDWMGAEDLKDGSISLRRYHLPPIMPAFYNKFIKPYVVTGSQLDNNIQGTITRSLADWNKLSNRKKKKIKVVAEVSAKAWKNLASAMVPGTKAPYGPESPQQEQDRKKLVEGLGVALAIVDNNTNVMEQYNLGNAGGLRAWTKASWEAYREVNKALGLGDPGVPRDQQPDEKPVTLKYLKYIFAAAIGGYAIWWVVPVLAPFLRISKRARSKAIESGKKVEAAMKEHDEN